MKDHIHPKIDVIGTETGRHVATPSSGLEVFLGVYERYLRGIMRRYPADYGYGPEKVPGVMVNIREALVTGNYNKMGKAFVATCKELGIPHTNKAINDFVAPKGE